MNVHERGAVLWLSDQRERHGGNQFEYFITAQQRRGKCTAIRSVSMEPASQSSCIHVSGRNAKGASTLGSLVDRQCCLRRTGLLVVGNICCRHLQAEHQPFGCAIASPGGTHPVKMISQP